MRIPIVNTDSVGIIEDQSPHNLPLSAWSNGRNVRMIDGKVQKMSGHQPSFAPFIAPKFLMSFQHPNGYYWLYAGDANVVAYQTGAQYDITPLTPFNLADAQWSGSVLNGIPILNYAGSIPQQWVNPSPTTKLANLTNWPIDWRCRNIKPFKNYLVALGVVKGAVTQPYNVNWSHPADPGTVPISWDIADATKDAGEVTLADTPGFCLNQLEMGDLNLIYKEDSVYTMQYTGGQSIFTFRRLFKENIGLLMMNGLISFTPPGKSTHHMVFTPNDLIVHDGRSITPILEGRMRRWLYNNLDSDSFKNSFIVNNFLFKEIWVCFPLVGSVWANCALVWNYFTDTCTIRDLPSVAFGAVGQINEIQSGQTKSSWDLDDAAWDADTTTWGSSAYQPVTSRLLMVSPSVIKTFVMDVGTQFEAALYNSFVERTGLTITGQDRNGKPIEDSESVKLVTEVWLRAEGNVGTVLNVSVGTQDDRGQSPVWNGPYPFVIGVDKKINPLVSGRIVSIKIESSEASQWELHGYDLNIVPAGAY